MPSGIPRRMTTEDLRRRLPPLVARPQPDTGPRCRSQRSFPHFVPLSRFAWSPAGEPGRLRDRVDGPLPAACWESCRTGPPIRRLTPARVPGGQPVPGPASRSGPSWRDCPAPSAGTQRRGIAAIAVTGPAAAEPGSPGDEPGPGMTPGQTGWITVTLAGCRALAGDRGQVLRLCTARSVPLGKYWRGSPLVSSLLPRCKGNAGRRSRCPGR